MRAVLGGVILALTGSVAAAQPDADLARTLFPNGNYRATLGAVRPLDADATLEIGAGNGHAFTFRWVRFRSVRDGVEVLSLGLDQGFRPYTSKWPPDRAPVTVKRARMARAAYADLLHGLAVVDAVQLAPVRRNSFGMSSNDFWVSARLVANKATLVDLDWAGYETGQAAAEFGKPLAAVDLGRAAAKGLAFKEQTLTDEERAWASDKFARDWKRYQDRESYWWVRERSLIMVGVVGNAAALPALRDALGGDPKDRCVYHAINAVTRLTGTDVRDKPVEEMDTAKVRQRVLEALDKK